MKRSQTKVPYSQEESRYRVVVESDPCRSGTVEAMQIQFDLLLNLAQDPMLSLCGPVYFQTMKMRHNGVAWIAEFEAIVSEPRP